jgi:APA family basic amino acid/polyamine antiporter
MTVKTKGISLVTATAIIVADMIGTGVFTSLGFQVATLPSGFAVLMLWIVGGICAFCGAVSYAELAAALPRSGGEYHFLSRIYHPSVGFLAGWISATVGFAAPIALAAMAAGSYAHGVLPGLDPKLISFVIVWLVTLFHLRDLKLGATFQNISTLFKVLLIVGFIIAGFLAPDIEPVAFTPSGDDWLLLASSPFAIGLIFVMYSYSGWNASTYISNEIRDPQRNVPRSLFLGTLVVALLYVLINAVFLRVAPMKEMAGKVDVGLIAGHHLFGETGGALMGGLIAIGLISSISSMTWIGPRVSMTMGEDFSALRFLAARTQRGIPLFAMTVQFVIVNLLLLTSSFEKVLVYIQITLVLSSFATVLGVIVLRIRQPDLPRPFKTLGYPVTPLVFLVVSLFMMFYIAQSRPAESLAGCLTLFAGLLVYFAARTRGFQHTDAQRPKSETET